jgi:hypothetical protein
VRLDRTASRLHRRFHGCPRLSLLALALLLTSADRRLADSPPPATRLVGWSVGSESRARSKRASTPLDAATCAVDGS